jgi:hypothetical protein
MKSESIHGSALEVGTVMLEAMSCSDSFSYFDAS